MLDHLWAIEEDESAAQAHGAVAADRFAAFVAAIGIATETENDQEQAKQRYLLVAGQRDVWRYGRCLDRTFSIANRRGCRTRTIGGPGQ